MLQPLGSCRRQRPFWPSRSWQRPTGPRPWRPAAASDARRFCFVQRFLHSFEPSTQKLTIEYYVQNTTQYELLLQLLMTIQCIMDLWISSLVADASILLPGDRQACGPSGRTSQCGCQAETSDLEGELVMNSLDFEQI